MIRDTEFFPEIDSRLKVMDLGMSSYETVWGLQKELQARRISGKIGDHLLLVEHEPVYTLGKISHKAHLLRSNDHGISVIQTDRGGDITFHGPGQLVGYPILDVLSDFKINADRKKGLTGVWIQDEKVAALGVRISRWVTMHGFALNVDPDLSFYEGIIPCGIRDFGVTSMATLLGHDIDMSAVKKALVNHFKTIFNF